MEAPLSLTLFLPALNEAESLPIVIDKTMACFGEHGIEGTIIIVDDGSTDNTPRVVAALQEQYLARYGSNVILCVRHAVNCGYGAALRSGMTAALAQTESEWIGFFDADLQFDAEDLVRMLEMAITEMVEMVVGVRESRADSFRRRLMGDSWSWLTHTLYGFPATDVDCGMKLFSRRLVEAMLPELNGMFAEISAQIFAYAHQHGIPFAELGVSHHERQHGKQTGSDLNVVYSSVTGLLKGVTRYRLSKRGISLAQAKRAAAVSALSVLGLTAGIVIYKNRRGLA